MRGQYVTDYGGNRSGKTALTGSHGTWSTGDTALRTVATKTSEPRTLRSRDTPSEEGLCPERVEVSALDRGVEETWVEGGR